MNSGQWEVPPALRRLAETTPFGVREWQRAYYAFGDRSYWPCLVDSILRLGVYPDHAFELVKLLREEE